MTDCAECHVPKRAAPSVRALLPAGRIFPAYSFDDSVPEAERSAWIEAFRAGLDVFQVAAVARPGGGAVPARIEVSLDAGEGRTEAGTSFEVARARAVLRLHRVRVEVESPPVVGTNRGETVRSALADAAERLSDAIGP